jgi:hypothetical protein
MTPCARLEARQSLGAHHRGGGAINSTVGAYPACSGGQAKKRASSPARPCRSWARLSCEKVTCTSSCVRGSVKIHHGVPPDDVPGNRRAFIAHLRPRTGALDLEARKEGGERPHNQSAKGCDQPVVDGLRF